VLEGSAPSTFVLARANRVHRGLEWQTYFAFASKYIIEEVRRAEPPGDAENK
jgi:hypothetical protein